MASDTVLSRSYATVVYPDNPASSDFLKTLNELHIPAFVSPLHDRDLMDDGVTLKKPHYHVQLLFSGKKSVTQAIDIFDELGGVGCEVVHNASSYAAYLIHLYDKDKAQYNKADVICFGGADYKKVISSKVDRRHEVLADMQEWCQENNCSSFYELAEYIRTQKKTDWQKELYNSAYYMSVWLKSRGWTLAQRALEDGDML